MAGRLKLGQLLVTKGLIAPEQLAAALGEQERWGSRLGMTLVRMGFLEEETLVHVLAGQLRLPVARIRGKTVNPEVLERVPTEVAEKYRCLPLFQREEGGVKHLVLAMEDPSDLEALDELAFQTGEKLRPVLVAPTELEEAMHRHYHGAAMAANPDPLRVGLVDGETAPELPPLDAGVDPASVDLGSEVAAADDPDASSASGTRATVDPDLEAAAEELDTAARALAAPGPVDLDAAPDSLDLDVAPGSLDLDVAPGSLDLDAAPPAAPDGDEAAAAMPTAQGSDEGAAATSTAAPRAAAAEVAPDAPRSAAPAAMEPGIILRALSQLLVEKGVITREEFVQRLREIAEEAEAADTAGTAGSA